MIPAFRYARTSGITPALSSCMLSRAVVVDPVVEFAQVHFHHHYAFARLHVCPARPRPRNAPSVHGRNPWLCSLKLGSISSCSFCSSTCWISRSSPGGIPSSHWLPSGLGIITLRTCAGHWLTRWHPRCRRSSSRRTPPRGLGRLSPSCTRPGCPSIAAGAGIAEPIAAHHCARERPPRRASDATPWPDHRSTA